MASSISQGVVVTASQCVKEVNVMVGEVSEDKIGTISRLLTPMVVAATPFYETFYNLKEEERIKIVFHFSRTVNEDERIGVGPENQPECQDAHPKTLNGQVSILCCHMHPYLDRKVWMETKDLIDSTFLKVISIEGDISGTGYKEDHKTKLKKTTIKEKLGAFVVTRDLLAKAKTDKEKGAKTDKDKPKGGARGQNESAPSLGKMKGSGYIMLALDVQEEVPCHSCGYPTMTALAPESLTKFDRKYTCSTSCFRSLQHYKSADTKILQTNTVKRVSDALRAATAFAVKALRLANAEELQGGGDSASDSMTAATKNQVHIVKMLQLSLSFIWNASHWVADGCNRRLYNAKTYSGLANGMPAMGQLQPTLIGKKGKEWCTTLTTQTKNSKRNVDLDVTKHVEWETIFTQIKTQWASPMVAQPLTQKKGQAVPLNVAAAVLRDSERHTTDREVKQLRKDLLAMKIERESFSNQVKTEKKKVEDLTMELNELRLKLEAESVRAGRAEVKLSAMLESKNHARAATLIQTAYRRYVKLSAMLESKNHARAATLIQTAYRRYVDFENFQMDLIHIITLQQLARCKAAINRVKELRLESVKDHNIHHQQDTTPMGKCVPNVASATIRTDAESENLFDTPEQVSGRSAPKKLQQKRGQPKTEPKDDKPTTHQKEDIACGWSNEELKEKEYGIERWQLKQYGVRKKHLDNLKLVMSKEYYPALQSVLERVTQCDSLINVEDVADAIRGVPMMKDTELLGTMEDVLENFLVEQDEYPAECQYIELGMKRNLLSKEVTERSKKLYDKKMRQSGQNKNMTIVECGVHVNTEVQMVMEMTKMILPNTVEFLTACEYSLQSLGSAFGDEFFMALHLIMRGCSNYMEHLKRYHSEQRYSVGDRGMCDLKELKMVMLEDYGEIPSPEEIRDLVAKCITANHAYASNFIYHLRVHEKGDLAIPKERDNRGVLKAMRDLPRSCKEKENSSKLLLSKMYELLRMPASAVGACNSFHHNDWLMNVAMRQFGIGLLIVRDDDEDKDDWPYQTSNYLEELGSRVFLPLVFGMLYIPKDGNICIMRRRCSTTSGRLGGDNEDINHCCGYALSMKSDIRTKNVNLLTGVFDLSYTAFADFIHNPKNSGKMKGKRDYRVANYSELTKYRRAWDDYQIFQQDMRRAREAKRAKKAEESSQEGVPKHAPSTPRKDDDKKTSRARKFRTEKSEKQQRTPAQHQQVPQEERDMIKPENNIMSYVGANDIVKRSNRGWYVNNYHQMWKCLPEPEDIGGQTMTIDQSLRLLGRTIKTDGDCRDFFDDIKREEMIKECKKWWKEATKVCHSDKFNMRVLDEEMRKENDARFSCLKTALNALVEWSDLAKQGKKRDLTDKSNDLREWEGEIYVQKDDKYLDYDDYKQRKRKKTESR